MSISSESGNRFRAGQCGQNPVRWPKAHCKPRGGRNRTPPPPTALPRFPVHDPRPGEGSGQRVAEGRGGVDRGGDWNVRFAPSSRSVTNYEFGLETSHFLQLKQLP